MSERFKTAPSFGADHTCTARITAFGILVQRTNANRMAVRRMQLPHTHAVPFVRVPQVDDFRAEALIDHTCSTFFHLPVRVHTYAEWNTLRSYTRISVHVWHRDVASCYLQPSCVFRFDFGRRRAAFPPRRSRSYLYHRVRRCDDELLQSSVLCFPAPRATVDQSTTAPASSNAPSVRHHSCP